MSDYVAEIAITGLAIVDVAKNQVHFVDATKMKGEHRHYPSITFRPENYGGDPIPKKGFKKMLRPAVNGDFAITFPLKGEVAVGTDGEVSKGGTSTGKAGGSAEPYGSLDEIVLRSQLGYTTLANDYENRAITSIQFQGGTFYAAKRMLDDAGDYQEFATADGTVQHFCEHIVWVREMDRPLIIDSKKWTYKFRGLDTGARAVLEVSLTNLPRSGRVGAAGGPDDFRYFRHLKMLGSLGFACGSFDPPDPQGGPISAGSESCSPVRRDT